MATTILCIQVINFVKKMIYYSDSLSCSSSHPILPKMRLVHKHTCAI